MQRLKASLKDGSLNTLEQVVDFSVTCKCPDITDHEKCFNQEHGHTSRSKHETSPLFPLSFLFISFFVCLIFAPVHLSLFLWSLSVTPSTIFPLLFLSFIYPTACVVSSLNILVQPCNLHAPLSRYHLILAALFHKHPSQCVRLISQLPIS